MIWFYSSNNQPAGPVDDPEFARLVETGVVTATTLVWHDGLANWQPYNDVRQAALAGAGAASQLSVAPSPAAAGAVTAPGQTQCSQCGRIFPEDEVVTVGQYPVCAACKPVLVQKLREGVLGTRGGAAAALPYAGFWIRLGAAFLDGVILLPVLLVFWAGCFYIFSTHFADMATPKDTSSFLAMQGLQVAVGLGVSLIMGTYSAFCVSRFGATPGKRICDLRVVRGNGARLTFWRALGRYGAKTLLRLFPLFGILLDSAFIFFDPERRALHDQICDTRVIYSK